MKKSKLVPALLVTLVSSTAIATITSTIAWFKGNNTINTDKKLGGEVLSGYFHSGKGTEEDPFTITTPWHYENFVKLHYNVTGYARAGFHFSFGYPFDETNSTFYETDSDGSVNFDSHNSTSLNLGGMVLPPLGTDDAPFFAHVEGNGLEITNFIIDGKGFSDIGIFGFVNMETEGDTTTLAEINNCYWRNFTIKTDGADISKHAHSDLNHAHDDKDGNNARVGYLAGHVVYSSSFTNCYVNDCKIEGSSGSRLVDNYSYYGMVEIDSIGGATGIGNDYKYTLNSEATYNYFNNHYNEISGNPIASRNTEYASEVRDTEFTNGGLDTKYPFSLGVNRASNTTYQINGTTPQTTASRNYSLSTLGYKELDPDTKTKYYDLFYKDGENFVPIEDADYEHRDGNKYLSIYGSTTEGYNDVAWSNIKTNGDYNGRSFIRSNNDLWEYYKTDSRATNNQDKNNKIPVKFILTFNTSYQLSVDGAATNEPSFQNGSQKTMLQIDDNAQVSITNPTITNGNHNPFSSVHNWNVSSYYYNYQIDLCVGTHYVSFATAFATDKNARATEVCFYYGSAAIYQQSFENYTYTMFVAPNAVEITQENFEEYKRTNKPIEITLNANNTIYDTYYTGRSGVFSDTRKGVLNDLIMLGQTGVLPERIYSDNALAPTQLYGRDINYSDKISSNYFKALDTNGTTFEYIQYQTGTQEVPIQAVDPNTGNPLVDGDGNPIYQQDYDEDGNPKFDDGGNPIYVTRTEPVYDYKWQAIVKPKKVLKPLTDDGGNIVYDEDGITPLPADPVFVANDDDTENELTAAGFNSKNIDVVGGGVSFVSTSFLGINIQVLEIQAERQGTRGLFNTWLIPPRICVFDPTSHIGEHFYATQFCPASVVLYLKNTANAADNRVNDYLGHIDFSYVDVGLGGESRIELTRPVFKKGATGTGTNQTIVSLDLEDFGSGKATQNEGISILSDVPCDIKEREAQICSYCCLDSNGDIVVVYDTNGNPHFKNGITSEEDKIKELLKIDTYVMVLGCQGTGTCYISNIDFNYKATSGYGGTFGTVGFRSSISQCGDNPEINDYTVPSTIINFYFDNPENNKFEILVTYAYDQKRYDITFKSTATIAINIFNYDPDNYSVYYNGELLTGSSNELTSGGF